MIAIVARLDVDAAKAQSLLDFLTPPRADTFVPRETILDAARTAVPGAFFGNQTGPLRRTCEFDASKRAAFPWKAKLRH